LKYLEFNSNYGKPINLSNKSTCIRFRRIKLRN